MTNHFNCQYCPYETTWAFCSQHHNRRHQYVPYSDCTVPIESCACLLSACQFEGTQTENQHSFLSQTDTSNIKWYQCEFCPHQSKTKSHLRLHISIKHSCYLDANLPEPDWYQCKRRAHKSRLKPNPKQQGAEPLFHSNSSFEDRTKGNITNEKSGEDLGEPSFSWSAQACRKRKCLGRKDEQIVRKNDIGKTGEDRRKKQDERSRSSEVLSDSASDSIVSEPSLKRRKQSPPVQVQAASKNKGKLIRNKGHACYFCQKMVISPARHFEIMHGKETDVAKLLALPKKSRSRRYGLVNLTRVGDFYHNSNVLATNKGELILIRRPTEEESLFVTFSDYGPCPHCLGFLLKKHIWHHIRSRCTARKRADTDPDRHVIAESNAILSTVFNNELSNEFVKHIFSRLREDEIGNYVKEDDLILKFGAMQFEKLGTTQCEQVRQTMRQLGRFVLQMREIDECKNHLTDYLAPQKFDSIIQATKILCASHQNGIDRSEFHMSSLALKIGYALRKCAAIKRGICLRTADLFGNETLISFLNLMELEWSSRIASNDSAIVHNRNNGETPLLPLTIDLIKLSSYIDAEIEKFYRCLLEYPSIQVWSRLASLTLSKVILFNKRRSAGASRMTVDDYLAKLVRSRQCTQELENALTDFEKTLAGKMTVIQIIGKDGRKVPVLLTQDMKRSVDLLNDTRDKIGIDRENPYLFARFGNLLTHMRGHHHLRKLCSDANLEQPDDITSTKLGGYMATVCQVLSLNRKEYDSLARHLGHDIEVQKEFCRLDDRAVELTKVSCLLIAKDEEDGVKFAEMELDGKDSEGEAQPKDATSIPRQCWSPEEKEVVFEFFKKSIESHAVPGKEDCSRCIQENPILSSRSWRNVKFCVKNQIDKIKKVRR